MPADHLIPDTDAFTDALSKMVQTAKGGNLVTLGIQQSRSEMGNGYFGAAGELFPGSGVIEVSRFIEKPDAIKAAELIDTGRCFLAEHWVVVSSTAVVTVGEEERLLSENQSTYILVGKMHRLYNPGHELLSSSLKCSLAPIWARKISSGWLMRMAGNSHWTHCLNISNIPSAQSLPLQLHYLLSFDTATVFG